MSRLAITFRRTVPLVLLLLGTLRLEATTLRILVLNGKDGKPAPGRTVEILKPGPSSEPLVTGKTDRQGFFNIDSSVLPKRIAIYVKGRLLCKGTYRGTSIQSVDEIISGGVVESNDCNSKVNRGREPGVMVLFVRRENLSEIFD